MKRNALVREVQSLDREILLYIEGRLDNFSKDDQKKLFEHLTFNLPKAKDFVFEKGSVSISKERRELLQSAIDPSEDKKPVVEGKRPFSAEQVRARRLGNKIRSLRGKLEWTQRQLAKFIKDAQTAQGKSVTITETDVYRLESGQTPKNLKHYDVCVWMENAILVKKSPASTPINKPAVECDHPA